MKKRYTYNRLSGTDIVVNESMRGVVEKLNWTCASTQEANPTPDAPKPIYSSGDGGKIVISNNGNTTDITTPVGYIGGSLPNGVADTDTQKKIGKVVLNGSEAWTIAGTQPTGTYSMYITNDIKATVGNTKLMCDRFKVINTSEFATYTDNCISGSTGAYQHIIS